MSMPSLSSTRAADAGHVFLVMELVEGRTVRDLLRENGPMLPALALSVIEPVLSALASAHRAGLVHRDIKPENILISDDGIVKVADFGLARAVELDDVANAYRRDDGHCRLLPAGADQPGPVRSALGRLLGRRRALRAAHRAGAILGKLADGHCLPTRARSGARPVVPRGHRSHRARRDRRAIDQQRSGEPTGRRERVPLRAAPDPLHAQPARRSDPPTAASRHAAFTSQHRRNGALGEWQDQRCGRRAASH